MKEKIRVAALQAAPVYLQLDPTVDKAVALIAETAKNGADLVAFPEAFFPGYPVWANLGSPLWGIQFYKQLYYNALTVPGRAMARISAAARENNIFVCISGTERDAGSLYLTQFWFDRGGNLIGKHRKIRPTGAERTIWGEGDGSMMQVYDTELGRLGGLQCFEHLMPGNLLVMDAQNEQIHVAAWPQASFDENHLFHHSVSVHASRYYALATGTYVLVTSDIVTEDLMDKVCGDDPALRAQFRIGCGSGARVFDPWGRVVSNQVHSDEEGIAYADIDFSEGFLAEAKFFMDCAGHYSKGSVVQITFNKEPQRAVITKGNDTDYSVPFEALQSE